MLAGITISTLAGENGLIARVQQTKQAQIESDMKEQLALALQDLQIEKLGDATLDDVTQEWIDSKIQNYQCTVQEDASISGKKIIMQKDGITMKFILDENFKITKIEDDGSSPQLTYEIQSREGDNVKILITITDKENGIKQIQFPDGDIGYYTGEEQKEQIGIDYTVELGVEYKFKITSGNGQEKEEIILINDYYHTITKNLGEGISIDNNAIKAAYNKPYQATITAGDEYIIDTITVTMGGEAVTVDKTTGIINIEKVTGDIEITVTAKKLEIVTTTPIVNTSTSASSSLGAYTQTKGKTSLYINFSATSNIGTCAIEPTVPFTVSENGKYKFKIIVIYQNQTIEKEVEVMVNQYAANGGFVAYDAGDWTQEEIEALQNSKLYDLNLSHIIGDGTFKLNSDDGINFTFGGFTYKGDTENESREGVITSRNQSTTSQKGLAKYEGWKILTSETKKDEDGNVIKNEDGTFRQYVTKIIHAGQSENFVYCYNGIYNNCYRAVYLLSNGEYYLDYKTLKDGTEIKPRNFDMYKDKKQLNLIEEVHCMRYNDVSGSEYYSNNSFLSIGVNYIVASVESSIGLKVVNHNGTSTGYNKEGCMGIRPVVSLKNGVYIESGDGTESSPYILAKE